MILRKSFLIVSLLVIAGCATKQRKARPTVEKYDPCPKTRLVNESEYKWNRIDRLVLRSARKRCKIMTVWPCCKTFVKRDKNIYYAECGNP